MLLLLFYAFKVENNDFCQNYLSTRYPVLKLFSRIACLIFVYIVPGFYDETYNLCTLCTRCQGLGGGQLANFGSTHAQRLGLLFQD